MHYVLETHAHADHLSGSQYLRNRFGSRVAIGARITEVQETLKALFDLPSDFPTDGSQIDRLQQDGEELRAGALDALFIEDYGVGRCDFPRGSAEDLYRSVQERLYALPGATRVFVGHDSQPGEHAVRWETSIGRSKEENLQLRQTTPLVVFVRFRKERDATLAAPRLLFPSVQINVNAARFPRPHANGQRYLAIPINLFHPTTEDGTPSDGQ